MMLIQKSQYCQMAWSVEGTIVLRAHIRLAKYFSSFARYGNMAIDGYVAIDGYMAIDGFHRRIRRQIDE